MNSSRFGERDWKSYPPFNLGSRKVVPADGEEEETFRFREDAREETVSSFERPSFLPVNVSPETWSDMFTYAMLAKGEVLGLGYADMVDKRIQISGNFLLKMMCGAASAEFDVEDLTRFMMEADKDGVDNQRLHFMWHSHGDLGVCWSGPDERSIEALVRSTGWLFSIVVNKRGEYLARYDQSEPVPLSVQNITVTSVAHVSDERLAAMMAELEAKMVDAPVYVPEQRHRKGGKGRKHMTFNAGSEGEAVDDEDVQVILLDGRSEDGTTEETEAAVEGQREEAEEVRLRGRTVGFGAHSDESDEAGGDRPLGRSGIGRGHTGRRR